jgi:hypothetical protein
MVVFNLLAVARRVLLVLFILLLIGLGVGGVLTNVIQGLGSGANEYRLVGIRRDVFRVLCVGLMLAVLSWSQLVSQFVRPRSSAVVRWMLCLGSFLLSLLWLLGTLVIATPATETTLVMSASFYALGLGLLSWMLAPQSWFRRRMA